MTKKIVPVQCVAVALHPELSAEYLAPFADPEVFDADGSRRCIKCGKRLSVRWGIQNGEVNCNECGWPGRYYHRLPDKTVQFCLQYMPKVVTRKKAAK